MALEGNVDSFGLAEILQLVAVQQKTGMLTVFSEARGTVLFFRDGKIISTRDRRRKAHDPFKEYLTRYGVLGREELIRISQISSQSKLDLTDILVSEGFLTQEELEKHWHKQIQETMHDTLTWDQCNYKFISSEEIVSGIKTLEHFNIDAMLMESMRRIDEFPRLLEAFPNDEVHIERTSKALPDEGVTQSAKQIYGILEKSMNLRDLIARGKLPVFEVYEALRLLADNGAIHTTDAQATIAAEVRTQKAIKKNRPNPIPFIAALVLFAAAALIGFRGVVVALTHGERTVVVATDELARTRFQTRLRWLVEAYYVENGTYPKSIDALVAAGFAPASLLQDVENHRIRYHLTGGRPALTLL